MGIEIDLSKLKEDIYLFLTFLIVAIAGSFMFIFIYFRNFFEHTDSYRLTIMSLGITIPMVFFNFMILALSDIRADVNDGIFDDNFVFGGLLVIPALDIPVLIGFFSNHLSKNFGVIFVLVLDALMLLSTILIRYFIKNSKTENKK